LAEVRSETRETARTAQQAPARAPQTEQPQQPPSSGALAVKHVLDRVLAACGLIVTAPLFAAVAIALHYRGDGRIIRRDDRLGERARFIRVRSFAVTDEMVQRSWGWRLVAGSGLTALPQLWAVARGEMSIIGPRPREIGYAPPPMRPGLTGLAQIEQLERCDQYARTWSLRLDARIVWRTMWRVLR
jgi:lipopolysaccharide/colanic/teichoic acid biosynthesis glycosyltransferase